MTRASVVPMLLAAAGGAAAPPAAVGSHLAPRSLEDQHGQRRSLDETTRWVVFQRDMDSADLVKEALRDAKAEPLASRGVVVLADVSAMPKLVARLFALPAMRRRAYPILLDRDGRASADLPARAGAATLLRLERLRVAEIEEFETASALRAALGLDPAAAPR